MKTSSLRAWLRPVLGLLVGAAASLLLLELALWIVHAFARPEARADLAPRAGERRILCIGDSNTYGVHLPAHESYPGRLQRYLDRAQDQPWRVINLGYPGQNTAQIRGRLRENLRAYEPEIVILWAGVNNTWSPAMRHLWDHPDPEPSAGLLENLLQKSRAYGALTMMLRESRSQLAQEGPPKKAGDGAVPGLDGAARGEGLGAVEKVDSRETRVAFTPAEVRHGILTDLRRIQTLCAEEGVHLLLADYFADRPSLLQTNAVITEFARENGVPLAALDETFAPALSALGEPRLCLADAHANALGNIEVARLILQALMETEWVERRAEWEAVPSIIDLCASGMLDVFAKSGSIAQAEVLFEPRWFYAIQLDALTRSSTGTLQPQRIEREEIERLLAGTRSRFFGRLDEQGQRSFELNFPLPPSADVVAWRLRASFWPKGREEDVHEASQTFELPVDRLR